MIDYRDKWKLQPGIIERLGTHQQPSRRELDEMGLLGLIVSLHPGEDLETSITSIRETGATVERVERVGTHDELSVITLPQNLDQLATIESVLFVEDAPDITLRNATTRWVIQTNVTNQTPVYDNGIHGEGQVIGVLDGRVDQGTAPSRPARSSPTTAAMAPIPTVPMSLELQRETTASTMTPVVSPTKPIWSPTRRPTLRKRVSPIA